jgi:uncharacterized membrane protein
MKVSRLLFALALLIALLEVFYFYPLMPEKMAVHFNASGIADGWGFKQGFFTAFGIVFILLTVLFGGISLLIRLLPDAWINLPNKDYWLAPERKKQTHDRITSQMLFIGAVTMLLLDSVMFLSLSANLSPRPSLPADMLWGMLAVFFIINITSIIILIRSFRLPEQHPDNR